MRFATGPEEPHPARAVGAHASSGTKPSVLRNRLAAVAIITAGRAANGSSTFSMP